MVLHFSLPSAASGHIKFLLIPHLTTSLPPSKPGNSSWFLSAVPHHDPALLPDSGSAVLTDSMTRASCSPWWPHAYLREPAGMQWCRIQRAFSRRVVKKQLHSQRSTTHLQPWFRPASIRPPALVWSQSSWSLAGVHYKHWAICVTPFFGRNFKYRGIEGENWAQCACVRR